MVLRVKVMVLVKCVKLCVISIAVNGFPTLIYVIIRLYCVQKTTGWAVGYSHTLTESEGKQEDHWGKAHLHLHPRFSACVSRLIECWAHLLWATCVTIIICWPAKVSIQAAACCHVRRGGWTMCLRWMRVCTAEIFQFPRLSKLHRIHTVCLHDLVGWEEKLLIKEI